MTLAWFPGSAIVARAQGSNPPAPVSAVTDDPKSWPADVKATYDDICALPGTSKDDIKSAIFQLAAKGRLARPAIAAIARQSDLSEPHRAFAGILLTHFSRFDPATLRKLVEEANPFEQREAIVLLGKLGGKENAEFLTDLAGKSTSKGLKAHIESVKSTLAEESLPAEALNLLDQVVNADAEAKKKAAVALSEEFGRKVASQLLAIVQSLVSDDDARTFAALALVHVNSSSVPDLVALCARSIHKTLRYCAISELASKGDEGEAALRKLLEDPKEPLAKNIQALLDKMSK